MTSFIGRQMEQIKLGDVKLGDGKEIGVKTIRCNNSKNYIKMVYFCPYIALFGAEMGVLTGLISFIGLTISIGWFV